MAKALLCIICGDQVGLGGQLLATGPICEDCVDPVEGLRPDGVLTPAESRLFESMEPAAIAAGVVDAPASAPTTTILSPRRVAREEIGSYETFGAPPPSRPASLAIPTKTTNEDDDRRAPVVPGPSSVPENNGEPPAAAAGERTASLPGGDVDFTAPPNRKWMSIDLEEWVFILGVLVATPREIHRFAHRQARARESQAIAEYGKARATRNVAFVPVLKWRRFQDQDPFREIGPITFVGPIALGPERVAAYNAALEWAARQCRLLKTGTPAYYAARELEE